MTFSIIQVFVINLLLPIGFLIILWKAKVQSKLEWVTFLLTAWTVFIWLFLSGPWDWLSYYLRIIFPLLLIIVTFLSWRKIKHQEVKIESKSKHRLSVGINLVLAFLFGMYSTLSISGLFTSDDAIELNFPLQDGVYYVGQGGSHEMINYHHAYEPQQYALDVVKLNSLGTRASGIYPDELEKYAIFGDNLYSPCEGNVVETRDGLSDLIPPDSNPEQPEGNYVALQCEQSEAILYIAHMQKGSISVEVDDAVTEETVIGKVGNSGNTSEPHLHIHAEKDGVGIPLKFNKRFLTRNGIIW
ncbi:Peptidase family M23 [Oceanobacillus limi]|uniref:Peptidase family M23 n=1 Tax=Oceanobacillus limi TaxID=930131 RepID=A0A1I0F095_9BACI|nr:M23 family metallopeptidase [Oceanobacillus limi]SET50801.1 Peptidase family M23 [Oceanobacillus limi]